MTLSDIEDFLIKADIASSNAPDAYTQTTLLPRLKQIAATALLGYATTRHSPKSGNAAQVMCLDFNLDINAHVWLDHLGTECSYASAGPSGAHLARAALLLAEEEAVRQSEQKSFSWSI